MDETHIRKGLVLPFNERESDDNFLSAVRKNLSLKDRYPDRILCGFRVDPKKDFQKTLTFAREHRVPVMKLHPTSQGFNITAP